ncbi:hypothetical protein ACOSQ3_027134 [Xanthoceras sorbifolium]
MIENQFNTRIQILKTDNGKEYFNSSLGNFLSNKGIIHQSTYANTPQQNGIAEKKNRHILKVARSLLFSSHVSKNFWDEAVLTAVFLINRVPSRVLKFLTPCQTLKTFYPHTGLMFDISLKIFGYTVFIHDTSPHRSKLDPKSIK